MSERTDLEKQMPPDWDGEPLILAHKIAELIDPLKDEGSGIDSGSSALAADLWITVNGQEYKMTIRKMPASIQ